MLKSEWGPGLCRRPKITQTIEHEQRQIQQNPKESYLLPSTATYLLGFKAVLTGENGCRFISPTAA